MATSCGFESHHRHQKKAAPCGSLSFGIWGLEPEGSWQGAGGALQPEVACAAAQVESHHRHHRSREAAKPLCFFYCRDSLFIFSPVVPVGQPDLAEDIAGHRIHLEIGEIDDLELLSAAELLFCEPTLRLDDADKTKVGTDSEYLPTKKSAPRPVNELWGLASEPVHDQSLSETGGSISLTAYADDLKEPLSS